MAEPRDRIAKRSSTAVSHRCTALLPGARPGADGFLGRPRAYRGTTLVLAGEWREAISLLEPAARGGADRPIGCRCVSLALALTGARCCAARPAMRRARASHRGWTSSRALWLASSRSEEGCYSLGGEGVRRRPGRRRIGARPAAAGAAAGSAAVRGVARTDSPAAASYRRRLSLGAQYQSRQGRLAGAGQGRAPDR